MEELSNSYYQQARKDLLNIVPINAKRILEFGCGFGELGKAIAKRQECELHGIEINSQATDKLGSTYNEFWINDIEAFEFNLLANTYDCILFPDVLEHLVDPWTVLRKSVNHISPGGHVVASLPNIRNFAIIYRLLLKGSWKYEQYGILDKTHLRFFTKTDIIAMFHDAGLEIEDIRVNKDNHKGFKGLLSKFSELFIADINVCQYLIKAKKIG